MGVLFHAEEMGVLFHAEEMGVLFRTIPAKKRWVSCFESFRIELLFRTTVSNAQTIERLERLQRKERVARRVVHGLRVMVGQHIGLR